jgi:hypothetical protein
MRSPAFRYRLLAIIVHLRTLSDEAALRPVLDEIATDGKKYAC